MIARRYTYPWKDVPPGKVELEAEGLVPAMTLDLALQHKGQIKYGIMLCDQGGISGDARAFLSTMGREHDFVSLAVPCSWVLAQQVRPDRLHVVETVGW